MLWGLVFYGLMAAAAVVWRIGFYGEPLLYANVSAAEAGLTLPQALSGAGYGVLVAAVVIGLSHRFTRATNWGDRMARALGETLTPLSLPNAVLIAFASGLAEELLFRGALQPRVGLLMASVMFGALHFGPRRDLLPWTAFAILAGLTFGWLYEWTGNLIAPVVAHTLINAVNLPWLMRDYGTPDASASASTD